VCIQRRARINEDTQYLPLFLLIFPGVKMTRPDKFQVSSSSKATDEEEKLALKNPVLKAIHLSSRQDDTG